VGDLDTFLAGRGDDPGVEVRLMAAELRRARRDARRCTDGPRGSRCDACQATLEFLEGTHGQPVVETYLGYALGKLAGEDRALEAALRLRELLAEVERDDA
jgi:hypothetical protein